MRDLVPAEHALGAEIKIVNDCTDGGKELSFPRLARWNLVWNIAFCRRAMIPHFLPYLFLLENNTMPSILRVD